jgi:hypothetical protein
VGGARGIYLHCLELGRTQVTRGVKCHIQKAVNATTIAVCVDFREHVLGSTTSNFHQQLAIFINHANFHSANRNRFGVSPSFCAQIDLPYNTTLLVLLSWPQAAALCRENKPVRTSSRFLVYRILTPHRFELQLTPAGRCWTMYNVT